MNTLEILEPVHPDALEKGTEATAIASIRRCGTAATRAGRPWSIPARIREGAWAGGSDAPEKRDLKIGFVPLTDCAPIVMAPLLGLDRKHGITITPSREGSWAAVRNKLLNGVLDAAHVLYGLVYGVQLGIGGPRRDMAVLMTLNQNGQGISFARQLRDRGVTTGAALSRWVLEAHHPCTLAHTFPTGTHALWLYYWLAAYGIDPLHDLRTIVVPPPQMVNQMRVGAMDGASVGEPWNAQAVHAGVGCTVATSQEVWADHPEKALGTTAAFVQQYPNTARALIMAILEASRYVDAMAHRPQVARVIAEPAYVNAPVAVLEPRLMGRYVSGTGKCWHDPHYLSFYRDGQVNFPYLSDGMWFLTQQRRWGLLHQDPDYLAVAHQVQQIGLYQEAAGHIHVPLPSEPMRRSCLIDGSVWDGSDPRGYAHGFAIKWRKRPRAAQA